MIFRECAKIIQWGKVVISTSSTGKAGYAKNEVGPLIYEVNSKWIKDLNIRAKSIKLFEDNIGKMVYDIRLGKIYWI